jgi:hypothetical protein
MMITYKVTVDEYGTKRWFNENGKLHRLDGPAVESANGSKEWYQNGERHRLDGPAYEYADGDKFWYQNGELHRLDGPAVEPSDGDKEWWVEDTQYSEEQFLAKIESMNRPCKGKKVTVEGVEYTLA